MSPQAAGVSVPTVSRFLNGSLRLPEPTARRIEAAIGALNYRPNPHARRLSLGRSDTIGLVVPDIANPFFAQFVAAVEAEADRRGLGVSLYATLNRPGREVGYLQLLERNHVDGLIFLTNHPDDGRARRAHRPRRPRRHRRRGRARRPRAPAVLRQPRGRPPRRRPPRRRRPPPRALPRRPPGDDHRPPAASPASAPASRPARRSPSGKATTPAPSAEAGRRFADGDRPGTGDLRDRRRDHRRPRRGAPRPRHRHPRRVRWSASTTSCPSTSSPRR